MPRLSANIAESEGSFANPEFPISRGNGLTGLRFAISGTISAPESNFAASIFGLESSRIHSIGFEFRFELSDGTVLRHDGFEVFVRLKVNCCGRQRQSLWSNPVIRYTTPESGREPGWLATR